MSVPTLLAAFTALTALATLPSLARGPLYHLKFNGPGPGQTVLIKSTSLSSGGKMTVTRGATRENGSMSITRDRTLERRLIGSGAQAQLEYKIIIDRTATIVDLGGVTNSEIQSGALVGQTVLGFRDSMDNWRLFLKSGTALNKQAIDIAELEAYENRHWFPKAGVQIGQTWTIDPGFLRHLTERDLGKASVEATMTFNTVQLVDQEQTAVLTFRVRTLGKKIDPIAGTASGALINVNGTVHVALDTMLDKKLTMSGTLATTAQEGDESTLVQLPVNMTVTKTIK